MILLSQKTNMIGSIKDSDLECLRNRNKNPYHQIPYCVRSSSLNPREGIFIDWDGHISFVFN